MKLWPRRPPRLTAFIPTVVTGRLLSATDNQKGDDIGRKQGLRRKPSPHYLLIPFSPFPPYSPAICCLLAAAVAWMSHAGDSNNPPACVAFLFPLFRHRSSSAFIWLLRALRGGLCRAAERLRPALSLLSCPSRHRE